MAANWTPEQQRGMDSIIDGPFASEDGFSFSTASSVYDPCGPYTPKSGCSTPYCRPPPLDFNASFSSHDSSFSYDPTPPTPTSHNYFPANGKIQMPLPMYYPSEIPVTPSRKSVSSMNNMDLDHNSMLQATLDFQCMSNATPPPTGAADQYTFLDLHSSPYVMPTPSRTLPSSTPADMSSIWSCNMDSPLSMFGPQSSPMTSPVKVEVKREMLSPSPLKSSPNSMSLSATARRQLFLNTAQEKTSALHRIQAEACEQVRSMQLDTQDSPYGTSDEADQIPRVPKWKYRCSAPNCTRAFKRKEHLKRHTDCAHDPNVPKFYCRFCGHVFRGRLDNFKTHVTLHTIPGNRRSSYFPEAAEELEKLEEKSRRCKRTKTKKA